MILGHRMWGLIGLAGNALKTCDVNDRPVSRLVCALRYSADCGQFLFWMQEAFVTPRNVVVRFNAEDVALVRLADNLLSAPRAQRPRADTDIVCPVLVRPTQVRR